MRTRRSQAERSRATRQVLIAAARALFSRDGYDSTPAGRVAGAAGVTTGALYHHFADKRDLFRAAFEAAEADLAGRIAQASAGGADPWSRLELGVTAYLRACHETEVRQLVLTDGPRVLGAEEWRERDAAHHLRALRAALAAAMRAGLVERRPPDPLARVLLGALTEAGLAVRDPEAAEDAVSWVIDRLRSRAAT